MLRGNILKFISKSIMSYSTDMALSVYPGNSIAIELSSACNINCLCCPVGNKVIGGNNMSPEIFRKIIQLLPANIKLLSFSHRGDPTMNPDFPEIIRMAHAKGYATDLYTNGLLLDRYIDRLMGSGLSAIRIDLDGASEESYLKYRIGSNFEKVKANIKLLVKARNTSAGNYPKKIIIICVVSSFNEHEIKQIQDIASGLGVDQLLFKTAIVNYGTKFYNDVSSQKSIAPKETSYQRGARSKRFICPFLWRGAIQYNGNLQICTADFEGRYILGNILQEGSFEKVFFSDKATKLRRAIVGQKAPLCGACCVTGHNHYIKDISQDYIRR